MPLLRAREPAQRGPVRDAAAAPARRARRRARGTRPTAGRALRTSSPHTCIGWPARSTRPATARPAGRCRWPSGTTSPRSFPATSSRRRASSRGCSGRSACRSGRAGRAAVPAPRPLGERDRGRRRAEARLDRRAAPAGRARLGPGGRRRRSSSTSARWPRSRAGRTATGPCRPSPRSSRTSPSSSTRTSRPPTCSRRRPHVGGRPARAAAALRRLPRRAGGRGQASRSRSGSSSARPTARSPTTRWPRCAGGSRRRSPRSEGSSVASVAVVGASGFAGALCAALVERHPRLELDVVTARSDAGRLLSDLYPRYRVDRKLETFDADRVAEGCDAALVAYPARRRGSDGRGTAHARAEGGRPLGRLPRAAGAVRALVRAAPRAEAARRGRLRADRAEPRRDPRGRARRRAGLLPDGRAARAAAAEGTRVGHVHRREVGRVGRRPRGDGDDALRLGRREPDAVQGRGAPPPGGARRVLRAGDVRAAPAADRPGADGELLRAPESRRHGGRGTRAVRGRLPRRPVRRGRRRAAGRARRARHQPLPDPRDRRERHGDGVRRDRQPVEGRRGSGGPGPQPDARLRRDGGTRSELLPLALGREARARHRARRRRAAEVLLLGGGGRGHQAEGARRGRPGVLRREHVGRPLHRRTRAWARR